MINGRTPKKGEIFKNPYFGKANSTIKFNYQSDKNPNSFILNIQNLLYNNYKQEVLIKTVSLT